MCVVSLASRSLLKLQSRIDVLDFSLRDNIKLPVLGIPSPK